MAFIRRGINSLTGNTRANRVLQAAAAAEPPDPPPPPPSPTFSPPNMAQAPSQAGNPQYGGAAGAAGFASTILTSPQGLVSRPRTSRRSLLGE